MMTAELNSQRVSYYTGVKLIRHHQSGSSANPSGYFHHHASHHHYPPPHSQQQHPQLHHPGHYLSCPTGPPHLQHPGPLHSAGGVLLSPHNNGSPHHQNGHHHHHQSNGYVGGGSNTTRLYTGSPLIRSTAHHSVQGGNNKRSFKQSRAHHNHNNSLHKNVGSHHNHHHPNSGGSCSSGTSSSSSSNEHLNNIIHQQSPSSPTQSSKSLDISPLKLASSPGSSQRYQNGDSSTNSSPGPDSPGLKSSPSPSSTLSSSSPNSTDGNKDLDHFYFLDEHWKPSSDGMGNSSSVIPGDLMDISSNSSGGSAQWNSSSASPSPPALHSSSTLTMMVDQFFGQENGGLGGFTLGDGDTGGLRDLNNNLVGQPDFNEIATHNHHQLHRHHSFSGFNSNSQSNQHGGASGLINFGTTTTKFGNSTVVNVETQIGTFNGQRDLEIRLCFIKGDRGGSGGTGFGHQPIDDEDRHRTKHLNQFPSMASTTTSAATVNGDGFVTSGNKMVAVIGDPFSNSRSSSVSTSDQQDQSTGGSGGHNNTNTISEFAVSNNNEIVQQD